MIVNTCICKQLAKKLKEEKETAEEAALMADSVFQVALLLRPPSV